ncbi:hypothetical protein RIF29_10777 [Crotalaria pallida]|uniref:non-specific serine/threonine protein kinase n=1 Tax=Crotalaria pallida TaxID=3830 RepID=A0AAN9FZ75_CROPI
MEETNTGSSSSSSAQKLPEWILPRRTKKLTEDYTLGKELGKGTFGTTHQCTHNATGRAFACKTIPKEGFSSKTDYDDVLREIQIMHHFSENPNIVKIHDTFEDESSVHLVMELCEGHELFNRIVEKGHYSEREAAKLIKTIVEDANLKAIDFGLSVFYQPGSLIKEPHRVSRSLRLMYLRIDAEPGVQKFGDIILWYMDIFMPAKCKLNHQAPASLDDYLTPPSLRLKECDIYCAYVIADNLSEEEIGGLKELFKMIDVDKSGTITFEELREGLNKRVGSKLLESEIKDLMDAADIDNSGTIVYKEFVAATLHLNKLDREENLLATFSYFDKDGCGYITIDEIQQVCKEFGLDDVHIDEMIKEIYQDNDDGQIDYAKFAAMMR